jgi:hypothetical protein
MRKILRIDGWNIKLIQWRPISFVRVDSRLRKLPLRHHDIDNAPGETLLGLVSFNKTPTNFCAPSYNYDSGCVAKRF